MNQPARNIALTENQNLELFSLRNKNGLTMDLTNLGARIISLRVPDAKGRLEDVVLGYDTPDQYLSDNQYLGSAIGRFGNRIAHGRFSLAGHQYQLTLNDGENSLHGGPGGFHNVIWEHRHQPPLRNSVELTYLSKDGEEGYPGNLQVALTYTLTDDNALQIDYHATTDKPTLVNLSHHSYFNLSGAGRGDILDTVLMINADSFTVVDKELIPTGELKKVDGTPFDFRSSRKIGEQINSADEQMQFGKGYDHNWVLNKKNGELSLAARATDGISGRILEMWTTEPGLQFYSGNFLDGKNIGKGGKPYGFRTGFCLEPQHFPDAPNQKEFLSTVLRPGEKYSQTTIYKFL